MSHSRHAVLGRIADPSWDRFVRTHPQGWLCHLSAWERVLQEAFPHITGHLLTIRDGDSIRAGLPVYQVSNWLFGNRLVSIPFATLSQPLTSDPEDADALLTGARTLVRVNGSRYIEIRTIGRLPGSLDGQWLRSDRFRHHSVALGIDLETLRKRFDRSCVRQRIDRALKSGIELVPVADQGGLKQFYALYVKLRRRIGFPPQPYRFILALWEAFSSSGQVEVRLAALGGTPIAGLLLFRFNGRVSAEYLVSDDSHREVSPNHLLVWDAMQRAHSDGFQVFDFGRTDVTNVSLMEFKKRWGTTESELPVYYHPPSYPNLESEPRLRAATQTAFHHLPDACCRWLGEHIYNHRA